MKRHLALILLIGCLIWTQNAMASPQPYFYPFVNPYEATVMELPQYLESKLPEKVPTREFTLQVFPTREIPDIFWYEAGLVCTLAYQNHKAPLIFVIAGTGSSHDTPRMKKLQKMLYQAGFHVISLTSPTHMDFVVNASEGLPGDSIDDAHDLYRVMELAYEKVRGTIDVSYFALTGYSLGAFNAAFISKRDEEKKIFNFSKVLLINPPVSLYDSVSTLDRLLVENVPGGMEKFEQWFRKVLAEFFYVTKEMEHAELSGDFLYNAYKRLSPSEENLAALIGLAFRMNSANMIFSADVMNGGGYIVPKNTQLSNSTSLTRYAMVSYSTRFVDYFNEYLFPYCRKREPNLTRQALLERLNLHYIEPYLKGSGKIGLVHNEDDIILMPGDVDYLQSVFGNRARIFPTGGHMGNMFHPAVASFMIDFLTGKEN
ncbi:MAG: alpha/beta hydrolase [Desulfuromonadaceae bacterium]|nr:alpha/beta hydrolase [Desulfuromonadaceae bacterium]MDD2849301.1 alpha/beta hydrolase [Desulfuromonadaceae bacterium]MDD4131928.1 alpha/beta hydrolase [Desulfuromonadaceae bacterium]